MLSGDPGSLGHVKLDRIDPKTGENTDIRLQKERTVTPVVSTKQMPNDIWQIKIDSFAPKDTAAQAPTGCHRHRVACRDTTSQK